MAAPSIRTRGMNHGLSATLGGDDNWVDTMRKLMVSLDTAICEMKRAQTELNRLK